MCIVPDCDADAKPAGCGWLCAGQPCGHSQHRDEFAALSHKLRNESDLDAAVEQVREVLLVREDVGLD